MLSDDILFSSITELAKLLKSRKISPVELTESYLQRLERYGERLGAVATDYARIGFDGSAHRRKRD
jgi:Asp-tRNA(Asn)/Glu-tRNA(Gln) amidotransferase A subunit family amidase